MTFGSARSSPKESRIDKAVPRRGPGAAKPTEVAWLHKRRRAVREAAKASRQAADAVPQPEPEPEGWTEGHSKELAFQDRKHLKKNA